MIFIAKNYKWHWNGTCSSKIASDKQTKKKRDKQTLRTEKQHKAKYFIWFPKSSLSFFVKYHRSWGRYAENLGNTIKYFAFCCFSVLIGYFSFFFLICLGSCSSYFRATGTVQTPFMFIYYGDHILMQEKIRCCH